ncbi:sushi, von Willebrand factor type A, EGF and pentraxin domain-containing protein 1-like [Nilaparvata lugens]|uniref:sushi, von Willebrand factor type A, EGF and pentraxin domain-containing protein 1-like n=1 Tax=Nilaparvata lugens TaxID=108931 RepID=UPI00193DFA46|nr:sushi, von Willebrand factor type A, EGF and pentraxin domain-containing protein 1-like [Nilaparvata lugens]
MYLQTIFLFSILVVAYGDDDKINLDVNNEFFSFGSKKKTESIAPSLENSVLKSKVEVLGEVLKEKVDELREAEKTRLLELVFLVDASSSVGQDNFASELKFVRKLLADLTISSNHTRVALVTFSSADKVLLELVFLVDASSSVGQDNFASELKFVRKLLADLTISSNHTRVALVTFSSADKVIRHIDQISGGGLSHNKCELMNLDIDYSGGGTFTLGAVLNAQELFSLARPGARCVLFLVTDGFSNGGDPRPVAASLKAEADVEILTFGISTGNTAELVDMASTPAHLHSFLLDSFTQFEALARRALHHDLAMGHYIAVETSHCRDECAPSAVCGCGLRTGFYSCLCPPGFYGPATADSSEPCIMCPNGTYSDGLVPGDITVCTPCPDVNHNTRFPAKAFEDCYCKQGYKTAEDDPSQCEMVHCPDLDVPENGFMVHGWCSTLMNAACGVRCDSAHTLDGSSIRICLPNGTWSGIPVTCTMVHCPDLDVPENGFMVHGWCSTLMNAACGVRCDSAHTLDGSSIRICLPNGTWSGIPVTCTIKRCPRLPIIENGNLTCYPDEPELDSPVDAECVATCDDGFFLIGSKKRTCLPLSKWDGRSNICKAMQCPALPPINNGFYSPENCTSRKKHEFGKMCEISCLPGYELHGPDQQKCLAKGVWSRRKETTTCLDVTPPMLQCPPDIFMTPDSSSGKALVSWIEPEPVDNSNESVLLWNEPALESPLLLGPGITVITYTATDPSFNQISCNFSIFVEDNEPPTVSNCDSDQSFLISVSERATANWLKPDFHDNSEQHLKIFESHNLNELPVGLSHITYTATDAFGNNVSCTLSVQVIEEMCELPNNPLNGRLNCSETLDNGGITCSVICNEGYSLITRNGGSRFICNSTFSDLELIPDCTETEIPSSVLQKGELSFEPADKSNDVCDNHVFLNQVRAVIQRYLESECEENEATCLVDNEVRTECDNRSGGGGEKSYASGLEERSNDVKYRRRRKVGNNSRVKVKFTMKVKTGKNKSDEILHGLTKNDLLMKAGIDVGVEPQLIIHEQLPLCSVGFVIRGDSCIKCPPGTLWANNTHCSPCQLGFYQPKPGQSQCLQCPEATSTRRVQARSGRACRSICPPGTYSRSRGKYPWNEGDMGVKPCINCPLGTFQPEHGALSCIKCANNQTTKQKGSNSRHQCIALANNSTSNMVKECKEIRRGHVTKYVGLNCTPHVDFCLTKPCLHAGTCLSNQTAHTCLCAPGFEGNECQNKIDECSLGPCQNGGECLQAVDGFYCHCPSSFEGQFCESKIDECSVDPCATGASCSNSKEGYTCKCGSEFSGKNCEISPCDRTDQPCMNRGFCHTDSNPTHQSYSCECSENWTGKHCNESLDKCASAPCLNSATCIAISGSLNFSCSCIAGFFGRFCETYVSSDFSLNFPIPGTLDYAKIRGPTKDLHEVSLCMWLQSSDRRNYGTLFSYATNSYDNTFTLTDYNGLVLYVNGRRVVTDAQVNDGSWHSVCVHWTALGGFWNLYLDGILKESGSGLSNNSNIPGNGVIVVGQDQDRVGGGFNPAEAFVGRLAGLDLWDFKLKDGMITAHAHNCNHNLSGNILTWSQLYHVLHGNVQVDESPLCKGCSALIAPQHSTLRLDDESMVGSLAHYQCDAGYVVAKWTQNSYHSRKCLKDGSWQGHAPICQKCYCGFPGYFPHGKIIGNSFFFKDEITYECFAGFKLVGAKKRICLENGTWSEISPTCQVESCPLLSRPDYAHMWLVVSSSFHMEFECERGYVLEGLALIRCLANGQWDSPAPTCSPVNCSTPERIGHFVPILRSTSYQFGSEVQFACDEGYEVDIELPPPSSFLTAVCNSSGHWSHNLHSFRCVQTRYRYCTEIAHIQSEKSTKGILFKYGDTIDIDCIPGYQLIGPKQRVCLLNGTWSGPQIVCKQTVCPALNQSASQLESNHFDIVVSNHSYGGSLVVKCKKGFELTVDDEVLKNLQWTCDKDGVWKGEISLADSVSWKCETEKEKQCFPPEEPSNGYVLEPEIEFTTHYPIGKMFNISCRQGYLLKGENFTECLKSGTWSHASRIICEAVECSIPTLPANTALTILSDTKYGSLAQFKCVPGFREFGLFSIHCQANGKWSRLRGKCLRISCNKPAVHPDAEISGDSYLYNARLKVTCPEGTLLKGDSTITCLSTGLWSDIPVCANIQL